MSDIFPKWTNKLPLKMIIGAAVTGTALVAGGWYYFTPKYANVGYQPLQPVAFSHAIHADQLGLDCRYCHSAVEKSWYSNVPATATCMNCHNQVLKDSAKLAPVRESYESGKPIPWVQIHKVPDYVYFNHSVHVNRGVSCVHCHGQLNKMDEVYQSKSLTMAFCLECHRNPEKFVRDPKQVFNLDYQVDAATQEANGKKIVHDWKIMSSQNCSACHR